MNSRTQRYLATLSDCLAATNATDASGSPLDLSSAIEHIVGTFMKTRDAGGKVMFVGNGGSASIASHMAIDLSKNGGIRALCFNEGAALTCYGNDLGFDQVFAAPLRMHADSNDLLVAISSSGQSSDILNAVSAARERACNVVTLSGFLPNNKLRDLGDINLYVGSSEYGFVEIAHLALCHTVLDLTMGWGAENSVSTQTSGRV